ncbi:FecR family protein [Arenibacter sp. 6A1]|uniref:FecR family protein n=1 Tax=Arenibacter sp. 6A1 TaxID=2720391 RepID=UPI0014477C2E|nr:FecR domain-containing protein [Arenibacter sp. 6A1]NKI27855.1 FecR family protein [Arenibacter sp. 6A1]
MKTNIKIIIRKYLQNTISEEDLDHLKDWISNKDNQKHFREYIYSHYNNKAYDAKRAFKLFEDATFDKKSVIQFKSVKTTIFKYAAVFVGLLVLSYTIFYFNQNKVTEQPENQVTLEVEGSGVKFLNTSVTKDLKGKDGQVLAKQNKNTLDYQGLGSEDGEIVFNVLRVPYGKTFQVLLPDQTHVILNAGSSLRYPNKFQKGKNREVYLEGEGYFKVSKNKNSPFIVKSNGITTEVFGTEFNISSYTDDSFTSVVLVEGSVGVTDNSERQSNFRTNLMLKPNEMASKTIGAEISIQQVDIADHVSWVDGTLFFKNESFGSIVKKLQRHYNVVVINNNKALEEKKFTGRFDIESIEQILKTFQKTNNFSYIITKNNIVINP